MCDRGPEDRMEGYKSHMIGRKGKKGTSQKKNRPRPHNEDEKDDENFIFDIVGDRINMLRNALLKNDYYVRFEKTDSSNDDVPIRLKPDRTMIEVQYPQYE